jgi:peptide/nickel transport system substrate-binding protein
MKRLLLVAAICCALIVSMAVPASAKALQIITPWEIDALDTTKDRVFGLMGIVEMLVAVGEGGDLVGRLAKSWTISDDKLTWSFELQPGVKFHDGSALTAETVAKSLQYAFDHKGVLSKAPIKEIAATGPLSLKITTAKPFTLLTAYLCHASSGIVAPASFDAKGKMTKIIGTGYYSITKLNGSKIMEVGIFPGYWGKKPSIKKVVFNAVNKLETRAMMMEAGQAQLGYVFSPMAADRFGKDPNFKVKRIPLARVRILKLNCGSPFFKDVLVRRAISFAIDRKSICKTILRNENLASTQLLPPTFKAWHNPDLEPLHFDRAKAKELLNKAGWKLGSDGVMQKDGKPFQVTLFTYTARPMLVTMATAIQAQLKKVGIKIDLKVGKWTVIPQEHKDGTMQMSLFSRNYGLLPDAGGTIANDYGNGGAAWGSMGWTSQRLDKVLAEYAMAFDSKSRIKARKEIASILQDELPVIPLAWTQKTVVNHKSLTGVFEDVFEQSFYLERVKWAE